MIIERKDMKVERRPHMRGGSGECSVTLLGGDSLQQHCRLISEILIPVGASIGEHEHAGETEYYIILEGQGIVCDDGADKPVKPGDVVVTSNGAKHSIRTLGEQPIRMVAVIVTDA
ncbi:MAG: cupin domain-containing protein [Spirochaetaceae bacterium]|nr:cupin domain-containing protein [Spirochaetaceae bacterium]